jgi:DNA-binding ferritin-like protein
MTEKIPTPADALKRLADACIAMDAAIKQMMPPLDEHRRDRAAMFKERFAIQDLQKILWMHNAEVFNNIQKIRRRLQND